MVVMMEKYSNQLEEIVAERTEQLQEEKRKTDALLYRMLPRYKIIINYMYSFIDFVVSNLYILSCFLDILEKWLRN